MENHEKRYKDLLNAIKVLRDNNPSDEGIQNWVNDNVPEFKESEDEKIWKEIISALQYANHKGVYDKHLAWLEKQCEQKPNDKVEPRFKVGDWVVTDKGDTVQIGAVNNGYYTMYNGMDFNMCYVDNCWHRWTIQDAKDGDVLQLGEVTAIFKKYIGNEHCTCYCSFCRTGEDNFYGCYNTTPASKEQRDLLFSKMKEAGYEWDVEKKELKEIKQPKLTAFEEAVKDMMNDYRDAIGDNDATTEEVKKHSEYLLSLIPQKPAWSEEDEKMCNASIRACQYMVEHFENSTKDYEDSIDWLKSIKERMK